MSDSGPETEMTSEEPAQESAQPELTPDEIFHILQNERRRMVLRYLQGKEEPVRMRDVAEQVAAWEHDTTVRGLSSSQRQRVYIPLYQSHLPKLDKLGVIEYQQSRGIVERKPLADVFDPYLNIEINGTSVETSAEDDERWHDYYLGVAAIGSVLLAGAVLELPLLGTLSGAAITLVLLALLTVVTVRRNMCG